MTKPNQAMLQRCPSHPPGQADRSGEAFPRRKPFQPCSMLYSCLRLIHIEAAAEQE